MEKAELITSLITTAITATSIILIWLVQFLIKKLTGQKTNKETSTLADITNYVIEAETKLGTGQGKAKLLYVLQKLGKKETNKKAIKQINDTHAILKTAKNTLKTRITELNNQEQGE